MIPPKRGLFAAGILLAGVLVAPLAWAGTRELISYFSYTSSSGANFTEFQVNPGPLIVGTDLALAPANANLYVRGRSDIGRPNITFQGTDDGLSIFSFILGANTGAIGVPDIRVGIGTTNPLEQLEITGNLRLPVTTATTGIIRSGASLLLHRFGTDNFFAGPNAGNLNLTLTGSRNTGLGTNSLSSLSSGNDNSAVGYNSLTVNTTGSNNTAAGSGALGSNTAGNDNTAVGKDSLTSNTTGSRNTAVGKDTLRSNAAGNENVAVGVSALFSNTTGSNNTAVGIGALFVNTVANGNTAVGVNCLRNNTVDNNTAAGVEALTSNTTGVQNTAVGWQALFSNTTGNNNTAVGRVALNSNTTGSDNTAGGMEALFGNGTGSRNTAVGFDALRNGVAGGDNTAIGVEALFTLSGSSNTAVGADAHRFNQGANNTAVGFRALEAPSSPLINTGSDNVVVGSQALDLNTTGSSNTAVGTRAGVTDVSGNANTFGNQNTFIGYEAGPGSSSQVNKATAIGYRAKVSISNAMALGGIVGTGNEVNVGIGIDGPAFRLDVAGDANGTQTLVSSDLRFKEEVIPLKEVLPHLEKLQGVSFEWNKLYQSLGRASPGRHIGLIAQEVEKEFPELVSTWQDGSGYRALDYNRFSAVLLEGIKELHQELETLRSENILLEKQASLLEKKMKFYSSREER